MTNLVPSFIKDSGRLLSAGVMNTYNTYSGNEINQADNPSVLAQPHMLRTEPLDADPIAPSNIINTNTDPQSFDPTNAVMM